ncbi:MAG TPA: hypothetical protein VNZ03_34375 [Terriglobales bacterium]|nr:hypothetical protein [Terriglobales bacterium]
MRNSGSKRFRVKRIDLGVGLALLVAWCAGTVAVASDVHAGSAHASPHSRSVIVHAKFGGFILGYDIDRGGNEGILTEYVAGNGDNAVVAAEAFDQTTGKIIKVVAKKTNTQDDYVTDGIYNHVGVVDFQTEVGFVAKNHFLTMNPVGSNKFTGKWSLAIKKNYFLEGISNNKSESTVAVVQQSDVETVPFYIFSSNISTNTFGPQIPFTDGNIGATPLIGYNSRLDHGVLVGSNGSPTTNPLVAIVNLVKGTIREFTAVGVGNVLGLAVDPVTNIAVFTTQGGPFTPPMVEFYDLGKESGFGLQFPGSNVGGDVEFDPVHRLFVVIAGDGTNNSLFEYDAKGSLKNSLTGGPLNNLATCCVLNPARRIGFGLVGAGGFTSLQSFTY